MKDLKTYVLETKKISSINDYVLEGFKLGKNKVEMKPEDDLYIVYEFSQNELWSDDHLWKCVTETYIDRLIIARGESGVRFDIYILLSKWLIYNKIFFLYKYFIYF